MGENGENQIFPFANPHDPPHPAGQWALLRFQFLAEKKNWFCQDPDADGNWEERVAPSVGLRERDIYIYI